MLIVISPAKKLDWQERDVATTSPVFPDDAVSLAETARGLQPSNLKKLMKISDDLARLNYERFRDFADAPDPDQTRPAAFAFAGDTYQGLEAATLDQDALGWAQRHLRILSGLYGVLRPLDAIQPYRLEMGSRLATDRGKTLYDYWGSQIAEALNQDAQETGSSVLINCASQEYFGAVPVKALNIPVITPQFLDDKGTGPKVISFFAKKARGAMARFIVENHITKTDQLLDFDTGGYAFDAMRSKDGAPVFMRNHPS